MVKLLLSLGAPDLMTRRIVASSSALAGRGMAIVETLADSWWADRTRAKSTVHAVLSL